MSNSITYESGLTCALQVRNLDSAIQWYQDVLSFKLLYKADGMKWAELSTGVPAVTVGLLQSEQLDGKGGATLTWGVKDIHEARKAIESKGTKFEGEIIEHPGLARLATFYDPDGNKMMLFQDLTPKSK
jgi:predicted enzyme related to lactoylglutathione lyase